jgi:uncharacterized membrane-anchored protein YhcB (DUF1043 family)
MELSTAQQILVVVLSTVLAISLIVAIVIGVMIINLLRKVRQITEKAERAVQSAEAVGEVIKNVAGPATLMKAVKFIADLAAKRK